MNIAPDRRIRAIAGITSLAVWFVYLATAGGTMATGDAVAMFEAARSMVDRGTLDVPAHQSSEAWRGTDGRYYTPFGIGQSLFDVPFLVAGRTAARVTGIRIGDPDTLPKAFVAAASTIPAAVAVGFGLLIAWRLSSDARSSVLTALVLAFGTMMWPYTKFGFNAALTTAALTAGVYGVAAGTADRRVWTVTAGGVGLAAALLTRHEMAIAAVVGLSWLVWEVRRDASARRLIAAAAAPVCVALVLWMTLNAVRFGNVWHTGHEPAFAAEGFRAFLVSPSGALLLYSPPALAGFALVALARGGNALSRLLLAVAVALFVFYASLEDWLGTRSYGPRYSYRSARCSSLRSRPGSRRRARAQFASQWPRCVSPVWRCRCRQSRSISRARESKRVSPRSLSAVTSGDGRPSSLTRVPRARLRGRVSPTSWRARPGQIAVPAGGHCSSGCHLASTSGGCICSTWACFPDPWRSAQACCRWRLPRG